MTSATRKPSGRPEIFCDFNAHWTDHGYNLNCPGSIADLSKLGFTLETAVGKQFTFVSGGDAADHLGNPDDLMRDGTVAYDPYWGYLAECGGGEFYCRSWLRSEP